MPEGTAGAGTPGAGSQDAGTGTPNAGAPGSTATPSSSGASPAGAGPGGNTPGAAGTPNSGAAGASGANTGARQFSYGEDRSTWVPPHRIREQTQRGQQLERELAIERQRVAALSGVKPPAPPEDPEVGAIRSQFNKLYPGLAKLEAMADKLEKFGDFDPSTVTRQSEHYWNSIGNNALTQLDAKVKDVIGGDLTPRARTFMHQAFVTFIQSDQELQERYVGQDPALFDEFLQEYQNGILDPYRRKVTSAQAPRDNAVRRLPRGGAGSSTIPGRGPTKLPVADTDEYHRAAWQNFQAQNGG